MSERYADYDRFAWAYNQHWGAFSQMVLPVLDVLMLKHLPEGARLLDVGCGTGHVTRKLVERGYRVTGLDGSEEMLRYARENAPAAEFLLEDARTFNLPPVFDGALSTFDSLNHIPERSGLQAVFERVAAALKPGGWFCFDMNMEPAYIAGWNGATGDSFDDHAYIWKNSYEPDLRRARFDATIFRMESGQWQRSDVTLWQYAYTQREIEEALEQAAFASHRAYQFNDDLELVPLTPEGLRAFYACRK